MNYIYSPGTAVTRMQVMQSVATNLVNSVNGINFGLMHFNPNSEDFDMDGSNDGGPVVFPVEDIATGRAGLVTALNSPLATPPGTFPLPAGNTPLSETLHEAFNYITGSAVNYGQNTSVAGSKDPMNSSAYDSPIEFECQKTHVVLLTDGQPIADTMSDTAILGLTDLNGGTFNSLVGSTCDLETYPVGMGHSGGECLDELGEFMFDGDLSTLPGQQNVTTHTIGFLVNLPVLQDTADRSGGQYYQANNTTTLTTALSSIITSILDTSATFTAPAVSINSFNQTRNLDDLYFSVFKPSGTSHWPGNLKKYRLRASDATIVDATGAPAIDPATGFFSDTSRSFWSTGVDGSDIEAGGAASLIPTSRNVYTYLGNSNLTVPSNRVEIANVPIDDTVLGTGAFGDPTRADVINFINGQDASDVDQDLDLTEPRNQMGDPLHAQPVSVVYGPLTTDARIYFATNDGYLHSIDTETGVEAWTFLPPEFLDQQIDLFKDNQTGTGSKTYGVDGSLRVQFIGDSDGIVEPGEKVFLYFGLRRGGDAYYALDVTNPDLPQLMWRRDSSDFSGMGQSWSSATPAKVTVPGTTQNTDKTVLVIGGGYDPGQDTYTATTDSVGNSIYIVDSQNGNLLWHGTKSGGDENFDTTNSNRDMDYSIPSDVRVIDLNGDGFADRMYAADMGGQIWRFDIDAFATAASNLVAGGVIAELGSSHLGGTPPLSATRRFYYAPDVALVSNDDYSFLHVGIGSGYRSHPNETSNRNRFYALRDYDTFNSLDLPAYRAITSIRDNDIDLIDVTSNTTASVPQGAAGWKLELSDGGWIGEKVLAETRTFNNEVYVTSFRPGTSGSNCEPALGTNRQYVMSIFNGAPVNNLDGSTGGGPLTHTDRYEEWVGAPPPETVFIFADDPACVGVTCPPVQCVDVNCGLSSFPNNPTRTFWSQESIE